MHVFVVYFGDWVGIVIFSIAWEGVQDTIDGASKLSASRDVHAINLSVYPAASKKLAPSTTWHASAEKRPTAVHHVRRFHAASALSYIACIGGRTGRVGTTARSQRMYARVAAVVHIGKNR